KALAAGEAGGPLLSLEITRAAPATAPSFSIETAPVSIERTVPTDRPLEASIGHGAGAGGMLSDNTPAGGSGAAGSQAAASAEIEVSAGRKFEVSVLRAAEIGSTAGYQSRHGR
ncbi:hypothetical protein K8I85_11855, partial [bacterium]|nr:hypothetical protein [bacterium]